MEAEHRAGLVPDALAALEPQVPELPVARHHCLRLRRHLHRHRHHRLRLTGRPDRSQPDCHFHRDDRDHDHDDDDDDDDVRLGAQDQRKDLIHQQQEPHSQERRCRSPDQRRQLRRVLPVPQERFLLRSQPSILPKKFPPVLSLAQALAQQRLRKYFQQQQHWRRDDLPGLLAAPG